MACIISDTDSSWETASSITEAHTSSEMERITTDTESSCRRLHTPDCTERSWDTISSASNSVSSNESEPENVYREILDRLDQWDIKFAQIEDQRRRHKVELKLYGKELQLWFVIHDHNQAARRVNLLAKHIDTPLMRLRTQLYGIEIKHFPTTERELNSLPISIIDEILEQMHLTRPEDQIGVYYDDMRRDLLHDKIGAIAGTRRISS